MLEVFLRSAQTVWSGSGQWPAAPVPEEALPFPKWTMQTVRAIVAADIPPEYAHAWSFMNGDHWQGGWGWAGPMVAHDDPGYMRLWTDILKMFCSRNVTREIVKTHVNGVLGRPFRWSLVPVKGSADERDATTTAEEALVAEASSAVRSWLDARQAHALLRSFLTDLLVPPGRSFLRLFLPRGAGTPVTPGSRVLQRAGLEFAATLAGIYAEKPTVTNARMYTDPDTQRQIGVSLFRSKRRTDSNNGNGNVPFQDAASLTYLDASGERTIIETLYEDNGQAAVGYQMGGRLAAYEGRRDPLITAQVLQQQRILNYAESMIPRNLTTSGFLDRIITSTQLNGKFVRDPTTGVEEFVPNPDALPRFGPGEVTVLQPLVLEDEAGKITVTNPSMQRGEPVAPDGGIKSSDHLYHNMLRECEQGHLVPTEDSESSVIRYGLSLLESAIVVTAAARWMIESALAWAEDLSGQRGKYTDKLRASVSCFINVGPVTPEQRAALVSAFEKSLLSRETAQELMGVEDVDSENDRIAAQPGAAIDLAIRMANSYKMLIDAGMPPRLAAINSGYSEEQAAEIETEQTKREQEQAKQQQDAQMKQMTLQAALQPKPAPSVPPSNNAAGLRAKRMGRPSGTAERNPGQGQDKSARALSKQKRSRQSP
jgi:hypothetical protein